MLTKPSRKGAAVDVPDAPADSPAGTMERFRDDLRRVLKPKRSPTATTVPHATKKRQSKGR